MNKIVTRGLGVSRSVVENSGPVSMGYGPPAALTSQESLERPLRLRLGQSGTKRRIDEVERVVVWAKLIEANGVAPRRDIKGSSPVKLSQGPSRSRVLVEHVSSRVRTAWDTVRVIAFRLKR